MMITRTESVKKSTAWWLARNFGKREKIDDDCGSSQCASSAITPDCCVRRNVWYIIPSISR